MQVSELTIKLLILFAPGIITNIFIRHFTVHNPISPFYFTIYSFLNGFLSYLILQVLCYIFFFGVSLFTCADWSHFFDDHSLKIWSSFDSKLQIPFLEVLSAIFVAIVMGLGLTYIVNHKLAYRWANKANLSFKSGDPDVWSLFLSSDDVFWVYVRNNKTDVTYYGQVYRYSEPGSVRELLLLDVSVCTSKTGELLYQSPVVYVTGEPADISIEVVEKKS